MTPIVSWKIVAWRSNWVFGFAVASWLYRWQGGVLLSQLAEPVLRDPKVDLIYWIFNYLGVCQAVVHTPISWIIDGVLLIFPLVFLFSNYQYFIGVSNFFKPFLAILYTVCLLVYIVSFNTFQTMHTHYLDGLLMASVVFGFSNNKTQNLLWQGLRYYTCWVYSCAFLWKLGRGFWNYPLHAKAIILAENGNYLAQHPHYYIAQIQLFLIQHPEFAHALLDIGMLVQSLFILGFFTKKLDKWLFILPFLFHTLTYILLDVAFWEFLVLQGAFLHFDEQGNND